MDAGYRTDAGRPRAVVTGASAGIGAAFARRLARDGYDLTVVARRAERLHALAQELADAHGSSVEVAQVDLADAAQVDSLARTVSDDDRVRLLVNCAGFAGYKPFVEQDPDEARALLDVHVGAATRLTRAVLPALVARGEGAVINVASLLAFSESLPVKPLPFRAVYAGAKAYLVAFTQALNTELAGTGVSAQVCCPGIVATEFHAVEGIDLSHSPFRPMTADAVVTASLAALAAGEPLCIPGLDDVQLIERYHEQQRLLVQLANRDRLAARYASA
jgi:short-subunit dehydrogenase